MRQEREAASLSIREVARRMAGDNEKRYDTYRRYIIRWENGHNTPDESNRNSYADAVGCPRSLFRDETRNLSADLMSAVSTAMRSIANDEARSEVAKILDPLGDMLEGLFDADDLDDEIAEAALHVQACAHIAIPRFRSGNPDQIRRSIRLLRRAVNRLDDAILSAGEMAA